MSLRVVWIIKGTEKFPIIEIDLEDREDTIKNLIKKYYPHNYAKGVPYIKNGRPMFVIWIFTDVSGFTPSTPIGVPLDTKFSSNLSLYDILWEFNRVFIKISDGESEYIYPLKYNKEDLRAIMNLSMLLS